MGEWEAGRVGGWKDGRVGGWASGRGWKDGRNLVDLLGSPPRNTARIQRNQKNKTSRRMGYVVCLALVVSTRNFGLFGFFGSWLCFVQMIIQEARGLPCQSTRRLLHVV